MFKDYRKDPFRFRAYKKLGFTQFLETREVWTVGEVPIHCDFYPASAKAPTLLFLPGIGTYVELYCELMSQLQQAGFNVVAMDLRGHGYSGGPRGYYKVEDIVADAMLVIDKIQSHSSGPIGLFGSSLGARLALAVAEADSRVDSLLCHTLFLSERPPDMMHQFGWQSLGFSAFFMPDFKVNFRTFVDVDSLLANSPMAEIADQDPLLVWDYPISTLNSVFNQPSRVLKEELPFPAAIMVGSRDEVLPPDYIKRLVKECRHPFHYEEIADGSHMLPFDHINDTLNAASMWFNETLTGTGRPKEG